MQIHVLIPAPPPNQTGPDRTENIFHFTTGLKLRSIIISGSIKPTMAKIEPRQTPVAWFSTRDQWAPTATKVPIPGMQGPINTVTSLNITHSLPWALFMLLTSTFFGSADRAGVYSRSEGGSGGRGRRVARAD